MSKRTVLSKLDVLIVDRNPHMRKVIGQVLRSFGIQNIEDASEGAEALQMMKRHAPGLVITDLNMEPLDGIQMTRILRNAPDSPGMDIPVILVTGHTDINTVRAARDVGITEVVTRPITAKALEGHILSAVERRARFVRARSFAGPDRRRGRRDPQAYNGPDRRSGRGEESGNDGELAQRHRA